MINVKSALVKLLDEQIDVWRPCEIIVLEGDKCIVLAAGYKFDEQFETWEVNPGEIAKYVKYDDCIKVIKYSS